MLLIYTVRGCEFIRISAIEIAAPKVLNLMVMKETASNDLFSCQIVPSWYIWESESSLIITPLSKYLNF